MNTLNTNYIDYDYVKQDMLIKVGLLPEHNTLIPHQTLQTLTVRNFNRAVKFSFFASGCKSQTYCHTNVDS